MKSSSRPSANALSLSLCLGTGGPELTSELVMGSVLRAEDVAGDDATNIAEDDVDADSDCTFVVPGGVVRHPASRGTISIRHHAKPL